MHNEQSRDSHSDDRRIGQQLRSAARDERPVFSAALHARIMGAVVTSSAAETVLPPQPHRTWRITASWAAIAAGLLIAATGSFEFWKVAQGPQTPEQPQATIVPASKTLAVATNPPQADFSFDDLNQTAADAVRLVVDQLPIEVPTDGWDLSPLE